MQSPQVFFLLTFLMLLGSPLHSEPVSAEGALRVWLDNFTVKEREDQPGQSSSARPAGSEIGGVLKGEFLPFSFEYGEHSSDDLLPSWKRSTTTEPAGIDVKQTVTWEDPETGLRVEWAVHQYGDRDAAELSLYFENRGTQPSALLRKIRPYRVSYTSPMEVIYCTGGVGGWWLPPVTQPIPPNFQPTTTRISPETAPLRIEAMDGWSSNHHLPFWLVMTPEGEGFYYGLGWTGQWVADFVSAPMGGVIAEAGMEHLNLRLHPGERISQPTLLVGHFSGGRWKGHNALRRTLSERYVPLLDGKKVLPPVSWNHYFGVGGNDIDEKKMVKAAGDMNGIGFEYFCQDAGWYNVDFWQSGDWRPNPSKFPNGLEPVARAVNLNGMKMGLWFDPERVTDAAYEAFPRKDLLVPARRGGEPALENGIHVWLVDLSRPEACDWVFETIGGYVKKLPLGWIRWDFNYPPLEMWIHSHDSEPERLGIKEIRYIEGLYSVLDRLNHEFPGLLVEWCAGGGRRIDLETLRRTHTQWKSDITGDGEITRPQLTGGNLFLPGNTMNSNLIRLESEYDYLSQFGGPLGFSLDCGALKPEKREQVREMISLYKELRPFLCEDYYPLFGDYPSDPQLWDGWQFHSPKDESGFFLVFHPSQSSTQAAQIHLVGLSPDQKYRLKSSHPGEFPETSMGRDLLSGFSVKLDQPRTAVLVRYQKE